jgi:hypothetical protein
MIAFLCLPLLVWRPSDDFYELWDLIISLDLVLLGFDLDFLWALGIVINDKKLL